MVVGVSAALTGDDDGAVAAPLMARSGSRALAAGPGVWVLVRDAGGRGAVVVPGGARLALGERHTLDGVRIPVGGGAVSAGQATLRR